MALGAAAATLLLLLLLLELLLLPPAAAGAAAATAAGAGTWSVTSRCAPMARPSAAHALLVLPATVAYNRALGTVVVDGGTGGTSAMVGGTPAAAALPARSRPPPGAHWPLARDPALPAASPGDNVLSVSRRASCSMSNPVPSSVAVRTANRSGPCWCPDDDTSLPRLCNTRSRRPTSSHRAISMLSLLGRIRPPDGGSGGISGVGARLPGISSAGASTAGGGVEGGTGGGGGGGAGKPGEPTAAVALIGAGRMGAGPAAADTAEVEDSRSESAVPGVATLSVPPARAAAISDDRRRREPPPGTVSACWLASDATAATTAAVSAASVASTAALTTAEPVMAPLTARASVAGDGCAAVCWLPSSALVGSDAGRVP